MITLDVWRSNPPPLRAIAQLVFGLALTLTAPDAASAQNPGQVTATDASLRVFLDCSGGGHRYCSSELYRQEIRFVAWVREPQDAEVHVILTSQEAGGGGARFTLDFAGRESLDGLTDRYTVTSSITDVDNETVDRIIQSLRLGLVRFAAAAGYGDRLVVGSAGQGGAVGPGGNEEGGEPGARTGPVEDPWDFWVFNIDGDAAIQVEDLQETREYGFSLNANRTTEAWKLDVRADGDFEREEFELPEEDRVIRNDQDSWSVSAFAVKSMGEHWGIGAEASADNSTRLNRDLLAAFGTGIEYNLFPYAESNRRVLLARYVVSAESVQYQDTTVFDLLEETTWLHAAHVNYEAREPWGNADVGIELRQYLDHADAWSLGFNGFVRYRLFRGFSVNLSGEYRRVRDQIYLPKRELSDEDVLLGRRQLPTDSQFEFEVGIGYSFGSIFNSAVNERFARGVR